MRTFAIFGSVYLALAYLYGTLFSRPQSGLYPFWCEYCEGWVDYPHGTHGLATHILGAIASLVFAFTLYRIIQHMWTAK